MSNFALLACARVHIAARLHLFARKLDEFQHFCRRPALIHTIIHEAKV